VIIFEVSAEELKAIVLGREFGSYRYFGCGSRIGILSDGVGYLCERST
jgi:hypothetical protein